MQKQVSDGKFPYFLPYTLRKCETETPEMEAFKKHKINVFIMTGYGRPIFVRYGDQIKCSSFLATISAIFGKLSIFYSDNPHPSTVHKVLHKQMTILLLKRKNISYLCICKSPKEELLLNSMMEFLNIQLISCLTDGVNRILESNPTYDPTINFINSTHSLLLSAIKTGLSSPCVLLNCIPILPLPAASRNQVCNMMKKNQQESLQIFLLMTLSHVVAVVKKKQMDFHNEDVFVLFNLLQTQKSLRSSQNWLTICLPGLSNEGNLFCYTSFITQQLIVVMLTDESFQKFYDFSTLCKQFKQEFFASQAYTKINNALTKPAFDFESCLDKIRLLQHFVVKHNELNQIVMSSYNYFGKNPKEFKEIVNNYAKVLKQQLMSGCQRKHKMHLQKIGNSIVGLYALGTYSIFFSGIQTLSLEDVKIILEGLFKWVKQQQGNLFILKYT